MYFSEIFQGSNRGFDIVIANPPYGETIKSNKKYFKRKYYCTEGKFEIYKYFLEKGINLLKQSGVLTYITPDTWLTLGYFKRLRKLLLCENNIKLLTMPLYNVFESATVDTIVSLIQKNGIKENNIIVFDFYNKEIEKRIDINKCKDSEDFIINIRKTDSVIDKLDTIKTELGDISEIWQGLIAYSSKSQPREYTSDKKLSEDFRRLLYGSDIGKYYISWKKGKYLKYGPWLHRPRPSYIFDREKILVQRIRNPKLKQRIIATIDYNKYLNGTGLSNILILKKYQDKYFLETILGIINSKLINHWFSYWFHDVNIKPDQLRKIPIKYNKEIYSKIKNIVDQILKITQDGNYLDDLNKKSKVEKFEEKINSLVYDLYELTPEDIKIVEDEEKLKTN